MHVCLSVGRGGYNEYRGLCVRVPGKGVVVSRGCRMSAAGVGMG